jgi:hypothetical protein
MLGSSGGQYEDDRLLGYSAVQTHINRLILQRCVDWYIGYDRVRLTSQNCGLYGPIVRPRLIAV